MCINSKLQAYADEKGITLEEAKRRVLETRKAPPAPKPTYHSSSLYDVECREIAAVEHLNRLDNDAGSHIPRATAHHKKPKPVRKPVFNKDPIEFASWAEAVKWTRANPTRKVKRHGWFGKYRPVPLKQ